MLLSPRLYNTTFFRNLFPVRHLFRCTALSSGHSARPSHLRSPMHSFVEVIGSGNDDCSSSIQLFFNEGRYLFECGDGTQRVCTEYTTKFGRLRGIYLNSLSAPSMGGVFGLLLTVADAGKDKISIAAPAGLCAIFDAARPFCHRPALNTTLHEIDLETPAAQLPITVTHDECVTIQAVPVTSRRDIEIDTSFGAHYDAVTYICRLHDLRGKFMPDRAAQLGVKKGPLFGKLQKGQSVVMDDGTVVTSADVMTPNTSGPVVLMIACPTINHIRNLTSSPALRPDALGLAAAPDGGSSRQCIMCHFGPREVLAHAEYRVWCNSFGSGVTHIPLHASIARRRTIFAAQGEDIALLHEVLDKQLFPLPWDLFVPGASESLDEAAQQNEKRRKLSDASMVSVSEDGENDECDSMLEKWTGNWVRAECKLKFTLSPTLQTGLDCSGVRPRFIEKKSAKAIQTLRNSMPTGRAEIVPDENDVKRPECISRLAKGTAAVRFLGTGAAIPGKHRNVSGILLDLFERGGVLLDCGEGTWGQMVRLMGLEGAQRAVGMLRVIFISHMHADHHLGLLTVLHQRSKALREMAEVRHGPQLVLIGPTYLREWVDAFQMGARVPLQQQVRAEDRAFRFFDARHVADPQAMQCKLFSDSLGLDIGCVEVVHCAQSYGVVLRDRVHGWKVVYSGDTRPCEGLAEAGRDATLAIHEATLEDDMHDEALDKLHCTTSEALQVCAEGMRAWRTILTHFSQRYPKIPRLDDGIAHKIYQGRAAIAFDFMCVDFTQLEDLPRVMMGVKECFLDEFQEPAEPLPLVS